MILALLISTALANDITVLRKGETFRARELSYVLPEPLYDSCLVKAQEAKDVKQLLTDAVEDHEEFRVRVEEELTKNSKALTRCDKQASALLFDVQQLSEQNKTLRRRNVWLTIGAGTVLALAGVQAGIALSN